MRIRALAAVVLLVACACAQHEPTVVDRDAALKETLVRMRRAIDQFQQDHKRYPRSLHELVPKYLKEIPIDPITGNATSWQLVTEETVQPSSDFATGSTATAAAPAQSAPVVIDVRSGAGAPYSSY